MPAANPATASARMSCDRVLVLVAFGFIVKMSVVTEPRKRLYHWWRRTLFAPTDGDAFRRKVDPRVIHALKTGQRFLDLSNALTATNSGHRQLCLAQICTNSTARQPDFFW